MPLYNNILSSRKKDGGNGAAAAATAKEPAPSLGLKLLQDHLLSKQRLKQQNQLQKKQQERSHEHKSSSQVVTESALHRQFENEWEPEDEYDPMVPNSYEILQAEFLRAEEEKRLAARAASLAGKKISTNLLDVLDELESDDEYTGDNVKKNKGTAIAPPPSLTTSSSIPDVAATVAKVVSPKASSISPGPIERGEPAGSSVAIKLMSKMGYKAGQGLGKDEQGMSGPLEVEKSGLNIGRILPVVSKKEHPQPQPQPQPPQSSEKPTEVEQKVIAATKVLLLQNMVGPGEVDEDLEAETKEECRKYGDVIKCLIFEIPNKRVPDDEAVRIFVEFSRPEAAVRAKADLDGRYFGGRIVRASFYSVDKFNKYELGP